MAKFCSNCGKELKENADVCLKCGVLVDKEENKKTSNNKTKKKKKGLPTWAIVLIILGCVMLIPLIIFIAFLVFMFNIVDDVRVDTKEYYNEHFNNYEIVEDGTIGDTLEIDGVKITLDKVLKYPSIGDNNPSDGDEYLVFFLDVENTSSSDKFITYLNFNGLVDDEKSLAKLLFDEIDGISNLNKRLEAGETTSGYVVFEVNKNWENFDLNYKKLASNSEITFYVTNESNDIDIEV